MIWECTICTNHFDGLAPPISCRSCGSPREYFTAYHYYGLPTPTAAAPDEAETVIRPSYTESILDPTPCFRFAARRYFNGDPQDFFRNFLETRRTFLAQQRFAGKGFNSGFFFGMTRAAAVAEKLHYSRLSLPRKDREVQDALEALRSAGQECVFLEVELSMKRIADLTDPIVLEYFLREGPARASFHPSGVPFSIARAIAPPAEGGNRHTDGIGYFAAVNGWEAIKFPSIRALQTAWDIEHLTRKDLLTKCAEDYPRASQDSVIDQLLNETIIVVFCGSLLARSISRYTWTDVEGNSVSGANPFFGVRPADLEDVRVAVRERLNLSPLKAAEQGLLTDEEIAEDYTAHEARWVKRNERI